MHGAKLLSKAAQSIQDAATPPPEDESQDPEGVAALQAKKEPLVESGRSDDMEAKKDVIDKAL